MSNPAERLITLIMLLQNRPNQKAAELAKQLGVSARTLQRYMVMLEEMGIPIYSDRGPHGGFSLVSGYKMPPLIFTPAEAAALSLGAGLVEEVWGSLFQEAARGALAKLEQVLPGEQREEVAWARRSLVTTGLHRVDPRLFTPHLEALRQAVREQRQVALLYQGGSTPQAAARLVDPYALVHRWGWWYMIAYCHLRAAVRMFRVDRIQSVTPCAETFQIPADFDARAYLEAEFRDPGGVLTRMRFTPQAARVALQNRSSWESLQELPDGSVEVTSWSPDLDWAANSTLAFGPLVKVIEPEAVARRVQEWARAVEELYSE